MKRLMQVALLSVCASSAAWGSAVPHENLVSLSRFEVSRITPVDLMAPPALVTLEGKANTGLPVTVQFVPGANTPVTITIPASSGRARDITKSEARELFVALVHRLLISPAKAMAFTAETVNDQQIYSMIDRLGLIPGAIPKMADGPAAGMTPARVKFARENRLTLAKASVRGLKYSYIDTQGPGEVVVLVPGYPDSWYEWRKTIPVLRKAGYRVISLDLPGLGDTEAPADLARYRSESIGEDTHLLVTGLGVKKYRIVGHDWGAPASWFTAITHSEAVVQHAVITTGHPRIFSELGKSVPAPKDLDGVALKGGYMMMFGASASAAPDYIGRAEGGKFYKWLSRNNPERFNHRRDLARPGALTNGRKHYAANLPSFYGDWANTPNSKVPTLGLLTRGDTEYLPSEQMMLADPFVDAAFTPLYLEHASHWPQLDQPELINKLLLDFFKSAPAHN